MSLATKETIEKTHWRAADGVAYTSQRFAEINSIAHITGFVHDLEDVDRFLAKLVQHYDTRMWLINQLVEHEKLSSFKELLEKRHAKSLVKHDLPSTLAACYCKRKWGMEAETVMLREVGIMLEQEGYQLVKKES